MPSGAAPPLVLGVGRFGKKQAMAKDQVVLELSSEEETSEPQSLGCDWVGSLTFWEMAVAQNYTGGVTQVLVHVSSYQGSILVPVF